MVKLFVKCIGSILPNQHRRERFYLGYIHCCGGLRKSKSYSIVPEKKYLSARLDYLEQCPVCGHTVTQLTRMDFDNRISTCRKVNDKARQLFETLQNSIIAQENSFPNYSPTRSKFYLYYNEYGVKKKCYSNLSTLKIGLFENKN